MAKRKPKSTSKPNPKSPEAKPEVKTESKPAVLHKMTAPETKSETTPETKSKKPSIKILSAAGVAPLPAEIASRLTEYILENYAGVSGVLIYGWSSGHPSKIVFHPINSQFGIRKIRI